MQFSTGSKGAAVKLLQANLAELGHDPGPVDGAYGQKTHAAARAFALVALPASRWPGMHASEGIDAFLVSEIEAAAKRENDRVDSRGVWVVSRDWKRDPVRAADRLAALGLTDAHIVLNDSADARKRPVFHVFGDGGDGTGSAPASGEATARRAVEAAATAYRKAGLRVHLTSWLLADRPYHVEAGRRLADLVAAIAPISVCWDAEESYDHHGLARDAVASKAAASSFAAHVGDLGVRQSITTYPSLLNGRALAALAASDHVEEVVLQCYATNTSQARPGAVQKYGIAQWDKSAAKAAGRRLVMALPLYGQADQARGWTAQNSLTTQWNAARSIREVRSVIWWASWDLKPGNTAAKFLRSLSDEA